LALIQIPERIRSRPRLTRAERGSFFVSHHDGTNEITTNILIAISLPYRRFQVDPSAREGKEWRDLKKKKTHCMD